ncbi:MAG: hypothetical protein J6X85_02485, partial [Ruminococcus sp.]|nr:hypothetical protein [Ruminococcus sp.]
MSQIKTVTTSAGENKISFDAFYAYIWLKNTGDADVYIADYSGASAGDVDTAELPAGEATRLTVKTQDVYVYGATTIEAHAQNFADTPFGWSEGAGGGGSDITVEPLSVTANDTYTAPSGKAYTPVTVNVQSSALDTIDAVDYVTTSDNGAVGFDINVDTDDVIEMDIAPINFSRSENAIAGKTSESEIYITGSEPHTPSEWNSLKFTQDMDTSAISANERRVFKFYATRGININLGFYSGTLYCYMKIYGIT